MRADISTEYENDVNGEPINRLTITYSSPGTGENITRCLSYEEVTPWDDLLKDFIGFLSCVYGYDIHKSVEIKRNFSREWFFEE